MGETIPAKPLEYLIARHTVGLSDPILDSDIQPFERLEDGLSGWSLSVVSRITESNT